MSQEHQDREDALFAVQKKKRKTTIKIYVECQVNLCSEKCECSGIQKNQ